MVDQKYSIFMMVRTTLSFCLRWIAGAWRQQDLAYVTDVTDVTETRGGQVGCMRYGAKDRISTSNTMVGPGSTIRTRAHGPNQGDRPPCAARETIRSSHEAAVDLDTLRHATSNSAQVTPHVQYFLRRIQTSGSSRCSSIIVLGSTLGS